MTKGAKIGIAIGVLGIVGVAVYFLLKPKSKNGASGQVDGNASDGGSVLKSGGGTNGNTTSPATCSGYKMGYLSERPNEIPVHFASPRPAKGTFDKNNVVKISNTNAFDGNYMVKSAWIDSSGNVGAIYIDIPYKPKGKTDRTFQDIGCITKIS